LTVAVKRDAASENRMRRDTRVRLHASLRPPRVIERLRAERAPGITRVVGRALARLPT
jgi:hypothetical protein